LTLLLRSHFARRSSNLLTICPPLGTSVAPQQTRLCCPTTVCSGTSVLTDISILPRIESTGTSSGSRQIHLAPIRGRPLTIRTASLGPRITPTWIGLTPFHQT